MKKTQICLSILSLCTASVAFAVDGTITFNGLLVDSTCTPTVSGGGAPGTAPDAIVTLPTLNISALNAINKTAGLTAFSISLDGGSSASDGCVISSPTSKTATPYFEPEMSKVNTDGRVINTGSATNVDIEILDQGQTAINLSHDATTQLTAVGTVNGSKHAYNYFARYFATGATTAGPVTGTVSYSIIYK